MKLVTKSIQLAVMITLSCMVVEAQTYEMRIFKSDDTEISYNVNSTNKCNSRRVWKSGQAAVPFGLPR